MINDSNQTKGTLFTCPRCGVTQFNAFVLNSGGNIESEPAPTNWQFYSRDRGYLCPSCAKLYIELIHKFFNEDCDEKI